MIKGLLRNKRKGDLIVSEILLQTKALTKQYGHQKAVDNVDIHIKKGAIYGFIGRNGAGKTTCMRMIGGLAKPTRYPCLDTLERICQRYAQEWAA